MKKDYWSDKTSGMHRFSSDEFLQKEAKEKLFHLSGGKSLLDFGCGSAELLEYYALQYSTCIEVDRSASMIGTAKKRLEFHHLEKKVRLVYQDDEHIWEYIDHAFGKGYKFERISVGQVIQYFTPRQTEDFICYASKYLAENGKICLFDIIHDKLYPLWRAGLFSYSNKTIRILCNLLRLKMPMLKNTI